ncbi:MAG: hypothetical protein OHK0012_27810 [Synechococcales cyanobacterium]
MEMFRDPIATPPIHNVIEQLLRVQTVVDHQFWLTLTEVSDLLGIPLADLVDPQTQQPLYPSFDWRNFRCQPVATAPGFWRIQSLGHATPSVVPLAVRKQVSTHPSSGSIPSEYVHLDDFLPPAQVEQILATALHQEPEFMATGVSSQDQSYRQSCFWPQFSQSPLWPSVLAAIETVMPDVMLALGIPSFPIAEIESQLTAHNDGNYYKIHNDNGSSDTATRVFTYVYYFHQQPKAYQGGELRIYDTKIENNFYVEAESFTTVEPRHNSIVFFLSRYLHEVMPVSCPSRRFADSRFTINGWIRSRTALPI